jgi:uncharacterized protein (TIGR00296 family)
MAELKSYDDIVIGKHGLMIDEPMARGVLLPQVPVEHKMDLSAYLSALCAKAGLPGKEWTQRQLRIKSFTATVFHESEHRALTGEKH